MILIVNQPDEPAQRILRAFDIWTGCIVWEPPQTGAVDSWGGTLSTAGGLVIFGEDSGALMAADAATEALGEFSDQSTLENVADDLQLRQYAVRRSGRWLEHHRVWIGGRWTGVNVLSGPSSAGDPPTPRANRATVSTYAR